MSRAASLGGQKNTWIITPALSLTKNQEYMVTYRYSSDNAGRDWCGVFMGKTPTAAGMTTTLKAETFMFWGTGHLTEDDILKEEVRFTATETGDFYIGLFDGADSSGADIRIYEISVTALATGAKPGDVIDMTVTPDPKGFLKADISCKAPTVDLTGNSISSLTKLEFLRNGTVINTVNNPNPGAQYKYTDTPEKNGNYTYGVVAYNAEGAGNPVEKTVKVGMEGVPAAVENVEAHETAPGVVSLTWTAPQYSINNGTNIALDPALLSYIVKAKDTEGNVTDTFGPFTEPKATINIPGTENAQKFIYFDVISRHNGGDGLAVTSNPVIVGKADEVPYIESFAGAKAGHTFMNESVNYGANWTFSNKTVQDGDGGSAIVFLSGYGAQANLYTGKINIPASGIYQLAFYYSAAMDNNYSEPNKLNVEISADGSSFETVGSYDVFTAAFQAASIELSKYAGKTIQVRFNADGRGAFYVVVDNIRILTVGDYDVMITPTDVPSQIEVFEPTELVYTVKNIGAKAAESYTVTLYNGANEVISTKRENNGLASGESRDYTFVVRSNEETTIGYYASVDFAADLNKENNRTPLTVINFEAPQLLPVANVQATVDGNNVTLTWLAPQGASFVAESPYHKLEGYQVYRDDRVLSASLIGDEEVTDKNVPDGTHTYTIVPVYGFGQGPASQAIEVKVDTSGIATIGVDAIPANAIFFDLTGRRVSHPAAGHYIMVNGTEATRVIVK